MICAGSGARNPLGASPRGWSGASRRAGLIVGLLLVSLVGCSPLEEPGGLRYEVGGVIRGIEETDGPTRLTIEHEAIPNFVDIDGEPVGMEAMTMTMTVWRGARIPTTLTVGDAIRFELDVQWDRIPSALIVALDTVEAQRRAEAEKTRVP